MLKIVGLIRTLSFVLFLGTLGLVYAYLPIMVEVLPDRLDLALHKSSFFYYVVALFTIVNLFTWGLSKLAHSLLMLPADTQRFQLALNWALFTILLRAHTFQLSLERCRPDPCQRPQRDAPH